MMFMGSVVELDYNHALLYNVVAQTMVILKYTLKHARGILRPTETTQQSLTDPREVKGKCRFPPKCTGSDVYEIW